MKFKKSIPYEITITPTPNEGFILKVGCVTVVYAGWTNLIQDLTEYFAEPEKVEKQYNEDIQSLSRVQIGTYGPSMPTLMNEAAIRQAELKSYTGKVLTPETEL